MNTKSNTTTELKFFEVRDRATCLPVCVLKLNRDSNHTSRTNALLQRVGYGENPCYLLSRLGGGGRSEYDSYEWGDRTLHVAHVYISGNWDNLDDGAIIDVEFILGETLTPKETDVVNYMF